MQEGDGFGMKELRVQTRQCFDLAARSKIPIFFIPDKGVFDRSEMNSDLMGSTTDKLSFNKGIFFPDMGNGTI